LDPFVTHPNFNGKYFKPGVCPLCYLWSNKVLLVTSGSETAYKSRKDVELVNEHMAALHGSPWRFLGQQGRATLLLADVSQLAEHPEIVEEMYETLMDGMKQDPKGWGFSSRQFESGTLTHDVQAVIVNESGGSDMGSITFGRVPQKEYEGGCHKFVEVRVVWDDGGVRKDDRDFLEFFLTSSIMLNLYDFSLDEIEDYFGLTEGKSP
jgi:hypothetical protein